MRRSPRPDAVGFTLVELIVSMAAFLLIMGVLLAATNQTGAIWRSTSGKVEQFREARNAYESITRRLSQATLNTYWDYERDAGGNPLRYIRQSELRFISGEAQSLLGEPSPIRPGHALFFQAPLGYVTEAAYKPFDNLLNTWGYYVEFGDDAVSRPSFVTEQVAPLRYRFRLKELMEPSNQLTLYNYTSGYDIGGTQNNLIYAGREWFRIPASSPSRVRVLSENIIALILLPKLSTQDDPSGTRLAPSYEYDSTATHPDPEINPKNQLPPVVQVTMVALDEASAGRLQTGDATPDLGLNGLFKNSEDFAVDLQQLEGGLIDRGLNYRVFTSNVSLKCAKWSRAQGN